MSCVGWLPVCLSHGASLLPEAHKALNYLGCDVDHTGRALPVYRCALLVEVRHRVLRMVFGLRDGSADVLLISAMSAPGK